MAAVATVTTSMGYPFTDAQWKELETQAMIYKYMVASIPVPPDLLIPIIRSISHQCSHYSPYSFGRGLTLGYGGKTDGEPGRCKRTDGKKWRCSREVAPYQKYCDRHLHRGRPRSRKLVEARTNNGTGATIFGNSRVKKTRSIGAVGFPSSAMASFSGGDGGGGGDSLAQQDDGVPPIFPGDHDNSSFVPLESSYKETRNVDWLMIGDNPSSASPYNSFPTSSYLGSADYHNSFFDTDPPVLSSLTLSMGGANDREIGSRLADSASWVTLARGGGPLAEALGHGIASTPSDPSSPNIPGNGNDEMGSSLTNSSGISSLRLAVSPFTKSGFDVQLCAPQNVLASFAN